jgi:hypothetical protein
LWASFWWCGGGLVLVWGTGAGIRRWNSFLAAVMIPRYEISQILKDLRQLFKYIEVLRGFYYLLEWCEAEI